MQPVPPHSVLPRRALHLLRAALACALLALPGLRARADVLVGLDVSSAYRHTKTSPGGPETGRAEARPGITLVFGSDQLVWNLEYRFSGGIGIKGDEPTSYHNDATLSLAAQPSPRLQLTLLAAASQGSTLERMTAASAAVAQATLRAPEDPSQVTVAATERLTYELAPNTRLGEMVAFNLSAPQDHPEFRSTSVTGTFSWNHTRPRDVYGLEYSPRYTELRPLLLTRPPLMTFLTHSLRLTWSRDLDPRWNFSTAAGVEVLRTLGSSRRGGEVVIDNAHRDTLHPTGNAILRYMGGRLGADVAYSHGAVPNLEEGSMGLSDAVTAGVSWNLQQTPLRTVSGSVSVLRSRPLRSVGVAAAQGKAVSFDVGIDWGLWGAWTTGARYSLSHQFDRVAGLDDSTLHGFMLTLAWQSNPNLEGAAPVPTSGSRVDGADGVQFPGERSQRTE